MILSRTTLGGTEFPADESMKRSPGEGGSMLCEWFPDELVYEVWFGTGSMIESG